MFAADLLQGRGVLITGGGSGLGLALAKRCAALGARVAICGRSEDRLTAAAATITSPHPVRTFAVDVRDYDRVGEMIRELSEDGFGLDTLVNNAAGNFYCTAEDLSPGGFKSVVDIVLHGTFNCSTHFGRRLIERRTGGAIVNIVTTYTQTGSAFVLPSACAKAGVQAMTSTLAFEWAEYGIRVNSIAPGPIPTEGAWQRLIPGKDFEAMYRERQPLKRFGRPEELADAAVFLLSDLASYITGECLTVDGGERLRGAQFNFLAELMPREKLRVLFNSMRPKR